jgi:hypothetical protein
VRAEAHRGGHVADQPPVRAGVAGGWDGGAGQGQGAFGVDHDPVGLAPHRGRQHDVGVAVGGGVGVGVLGDDQVGGAQPGDHPVPVRQAGGRVGADDPAGPDGAVGEPVEQVDGALVGLGADGAGRQVPHRLDEGAVGGAGHAALAGQAGPEVAHLAPAHGVGLAGQRERAGARPADRPGGQVQVAHGVGVPGAVGALVQPHGPQRHPGRPGLGDHGGGGADVGLAQAGDRGDPVRGVVGEERRHGLPALGVGGDEVGVDGAVGDQQV